MAERPLDPADFPGAPAENLQPGSMVLTPTAGPVNLRHINQWWTWTPARVVARIQKASGPPVRGREDHPVVHVAYEDAEAYATWAGRNLPSEAEWEAAARGGLDQMIFTWGDHPEPDSDPARQLLARGFSVATRRRLWDHDPGWIFSAERLRPLRHGGQCLGLDRGLVRRRPPGEIDKPCCIPRNPTRRRGGGQLRPPATPVPRTSQGDQGRLISVCRQLLHAIPPSCPSAADDRHGNEPHRLPMCRPRPHYVIM